MRLDNVVVLDTLIGFAIGSTIQDLKLGQGGQHGGFIGTINGEIEFFGLAGTFVVRMIVTMIMVVAVVMAVVFGGMKERQGCHGRHGKQGGNQRKFHGDSDD